VTRVVWFTPVFVISAAAVFLTVEHSPYIYPHAHHDVPDSESTKAALAARLAGLYAMALDDAEMRSHLPAEIQKNMGGGQHARATAQIGAPGAESTKAALAARLASLYAMALDDAEMRSHLPAEIQRGMGKGQYKYIPRGYRGDYTGEDGLRMHAGYDHESYLRSVGGDVTHACREAYGEFSAGVWWIRGDGYWPEFMDLCAELHTDRVTQHLNVNLASRLVEGCREKIRWGWFVDDDGMLTNPLQPGEGENIAFSQECIRAGIGWEPTMDLGQLSEREGKLRDRVASGAWSSEHLGYLLE